MEKVYGYASYRRIQEMIIHHYSWMWQLNPLVQKVCHHLDGKNKLPWERSVTSCTDGCIRRSYLAFLRPRSFQLKTKNSPISYDSSTFHNSQGIQIFEKYQNMLYMWLHTHVFYYMKLTWLSVKILKIKIHGTVYKGRFFPGVYFNWTYIAKI